MKPLKSHFEAKIAPFDRWTSPLKNQRFQGYQRYQRFKKLRLPQVWNISAASGYFKKVRDML